MCSIFLGGSTLSQEKLFEIEKTVSCGEKKFVISILEKEYGEVPIFLGEDEENNQIGYGVTLNKSTGSWTMIQFDGKIMCIVGSGIKASLSNAFSKNSI